MTADRDSDAGETIVLAHALLRRWRIEDAPALVRHANNRKIWRNLRDVFPHPYTELDTRAFIPRHSAEAPILNFTIEVDGEAAGGIGLHRRDDIHRRALEIGYWLGEVHWGRGIVSEAVRAVVLYAFAHFDVVRIEAEVFAHNAASARVLEKAGFALEGRARRRVTKDSRRSTRCSTCSCATRRSATQRLGEGPGAAGWASGLAHVAPPVAPVHVSPSKGSPRRGRPTTPREVETFAAPAAIRPRPPPAG